MVHGRFNGRIEATRREYKSKGKLICNTGYKLTGDSEATCQDDGTWKISGHCDEESWSWIFKALVITVIGVPALFLCTSGK
jgi:hypothetical protein